MKPFSLPKARSLAALLLALTLAGCAPAGASSAGNAAPSESASSAESAAPAESLAPAESAASSAAAEPADSETDAAAALVAELNDDALTHAWETWEDWDKVDPDVLNAWLDGLFPNRGTDPRYPNLDMDILQGDWYNEYDIDIALMTITISGDLCTIVNSGLGYQDYTVPCVLLDRSAEDNCPSLMILIYPQKPLDEWQDATGIPLYINAMTRYDRFETTDYGTFYRK